MAGIKEKPKHLSQCRLQDTVGHVPLPLHVSRRVQLKTQSTCQMNVLYSMYTMYSVVELAQPLLIPRWSDMYDLRLSPLILVQTHKGFMYLQ